MKFIGYVRSVFTHGIDFGGPDLSGPRCALQITAVDPKLERPRVVGEISLPTSYLTDSEVKLGDRFTVDFHPDNKE